MFSEKWKKEFITIPNLLSLFRITLIPCYTAIYLNATEQWHFLLAGSILAISCMTDMADGIIARRFHKITTVGKILDPLADKLTQFALIVSLTAKYKGLYPLLALFTAKELFQCSALLFFAQKGKALPGALFAGKLCTAVLFVSLIFLVLFPEIPSNIVLFLILTDTSFLIYSLFSYATAYFGKENSLTDLNRE